MKHSDVKLQCGDAVLSAHKSLLAARSPVFSAMFDHDMIEKQTGVVNIPEKDPETLKSFLDFIYTGRVDMKDYKSASKLIMVADEYQVASLKETCSMFLMSALTPENACEILELADMFNIKLLKNCALNYFAKHMQDISNSSQWSKFMQKEKNPKLWMEIIQHLAKNFEISPQGNKKELKNAATKITAPGRNAKTVFSK
ncbi:speckle-type POZ protein B [Parasteatoda tepidariorum]|uniref:speckle-type POZ protein B n=1 Tax=Parasteatoda tepidariorum TaxID=114398 RepID=UPI00077F8D95|nr:speckle-type POZ protein B [Parasteatoda tepidariorum]